MNGSRAAAGKRLVQVALALGLLGACTHESAVVRDPSTGLRADEPFYAAPTFERFARSYARLRCASWADRCASLGFGRRASCEAEIIAGLEATRKTRPVYVPSVGEACLVAVRHVARANREALDVFCGSALQAGRTVKIPTGERCKDDRSEGYVDSCGQEGPLERSCTKPYADSVGRCVEHPLVRVGAPCWLSPDGRTRPQCDAGSTCDDHSGRCEAIPTVGQPASHVEQVSCLLSYFADGICQPYRPIGGACTSDRECASDFCDGQTKRCAYDPSEPFQVDALCGPPR